MSFCNDDTASKVAKTSVTLSPMLSSAKPKIGAEPKASLPIQLIAASIFTASLQHVNHWPAQLLHAYAEDAFGPRLWVDRKECQLLVSNLQLALDKRVLATKVSDQVLQEADQVANFYANMMAHVPPEEEELPSVFRAPSSTSLSRETSLTRRGSTEEVAFPDDDSDSGEEEVVDMGNVAKSTTRRGGGGDDSSSSGEEEVVAMETSFDEGNKPEKPPIDLYPVLPKKINLERIRPRYFGANTELGFAGIASALEARLEMRSKQNSRLLQTLPDFCTVPGVRSLVAASLEKWLQSPALSGAARTLFSSTVHHLEDCDPPLPHDVEAIDAMLDMQLKANQLNVHIENITQVARQIPTAAVSRHLFLKLLRKAMSSMDNASQTSEHLKMACAVHSALSKSLSNDGLAAAILTLLAEPSPESNRRERDQLIRKIRMMLRRLFASLGPLQFDGCGLVESLLSFDFSPTPWSARDEEDKGRIMLECVTLQVPNPADDAGPIRGKNMKKFHKAAETTNGLSPEEVPRLKKMLLVARKLLITWCVMDYAPLWQAENNSSSSTKKSAFNPTKKKKDDVVGAGAPDFTSVLDNESTLSKDSTCPNAMLCVLFMLDPESQEMQDFLYPEGPPQQGDATLNEEMYRIRQCYQYGADLDSKMLGIVLTSASYPDGGINASVALTLIEHLFECCKIGRGAELRVVDANIVWEMYKLVEYHPDNIPEQPKGGGQFDDADDQFDDADDDDMGLAKSSQNGKTNGHTTPVVPRLARPGHWWRVTSLALVMIGASPEGIGATLSEQHPTLRELIKMVTSGRYRFPTVDCDDTQREEMKKGENDTRQKESNAAEFLFLSPEPKKKSRKDDKSFAQHGSRVSVRQRQRQEQALRDKREKEAANTLALATNRKKMLKAAQKSIMIWDPTGPARKPPKESVNLILSVERMFGLSETFQKCVEPDLIQATIGDTSRGAIERAYDWLIPVISSIPSVINRLPASASCFLLLRVYGTESEGNSKLRELSAPLLQHVRKTVTGGFGQEDAIGASNLLLADVADKNPARRRCARRVLEETLAELNKTIEDKSFGGAKCTWLHSLLLLGHINVLLPDAIKHISDALSHERGRVLRAFTLSLNNYIEFATKKGISGKWNFSSSLCDLISSRQSVCSDAIARFRDLRQLAITVVYEDFKGHLELKADEAELLQDETVVQFTPCRSYKDGIVGKARLPLSLLQSACGILSIWKDTESADDSSKELVNELANILIFPFDSPESLLLEADGVEGVASATMVGSGDRAVSVDGWVLLAKSRSDYIARRAALSAPAKFLPRLLLCSGLPKSSLLTMIDRVGKLGEKSESLDKVYRELLMPSATMDWGFGQIGTRREIARKLLGRLSAYITMSGDSPEKLSEEISFTFIGWLSEECRPSEKLRKGRPLKKAMRAGLASDIASRLSDAELLLAKVIELDDSPDISLPGDTSSTCSFKAPTATVMTTPPPESESNFESFIQDCCSRNDSDSLESWIEADLFSEQGPPPFKGRRTIVSQEKTSKFAVATLLLETSLSSSDSNPEWGRAVERWIPLLSCSEGTPKFWMALFSQHESDLNTACMVAACASTWCPFTSAACRDWILSNAKEWKSLDLQCVVSFLLQTSGQVAAHAPSFQRKGMCVSSWFQSKESVDGLVSVAFECAKQAGEVIVQRNDVAAWLKLLLLVAQAGKIQANHMLKTMLEKVDEAKHDGLRMLMGEAILRIYCYFPSNVSLGNPRLRTLLVDAAKSVDWRSWRTPMDERLNDMLAGLKLSPSQRLVHGLVEISKSHPLLLLRKLDVMADILENDAITRAAGGISRVRFQADSLEGPATAVYDGKEIRVTIRHWGYSYTDPLWVSFIEILLSVPREVLFSCGFKMGLDELLLGYVKLLYVQSQLQNREKATRLKSRFADLITVFEKDPAWNTWLASSVPGLDSLKTVQSVLVRCSLITTDQAMENIRAREK